MTRRFSRRTVLAGSVGALIAACSGGNESATPTSQATSTATRAIETSPTTSTTTTTTVPLLEPAPAPAFEGSNPFVLGLASGDPDDTSVVLWTRLLHADLADAQPVAWDVAMDEGFEELVATGIVDARADDAHSIHLMADQLSPASRYHYRFRIGAHEVCGSTRTTPAAGDASALRLGFSSCQAWESGTYAAHRHLAEADLDLTLWLGDYIYEGGPNDRGVADSRGARVHSSAAVQTLDAYRARYAQYKSDPHLQAHHAARPWIVTWDDHEVQNNYAGATPPADAVDGFAERRDAAYQAWWEHMPVRLPKPVPGEPFAIHRSVTWGNLVNMAVLDGRQYRDPQPTDGEPVELPGVTTVQTIGPTANDPNHSMLGLDQRGWVMNELASRTGTWTVLANQVYMHGINAVPIGSVPAINTDTWDGYHAARRMLLDAVSRDNNVVVLTGDFHAATVADVRADPYDSSLPVVASEFMAPAISSEFPPQLRPLAPLALIANPHVKHFEPDNGYMTCDVSESIWTTELFVLDDVTDENSAVRRTARFTVDAGRPGIATTEILEERV